MTSTPVKTEDYKSLDLHRLRTYVNERIKDSKRMEDYAIEIGKDSLAKACRHSKIVGMCIVNEIDELEGRPPTYVIT